MSNLNSIITVSISRNTTTPSQTGFGTPLILSADPQLNPVAGWGAERVRQYDSLTGVEVDFAIGTNVHEMATALFAQTPAPPRIKVGRRSTDLEAQTVTFTVDAGPVTDASIGFTINDSDYYIVSAGDASAAATAIDALTENEAVTFSAVTDTVTITGNVAGETFRFGGPRGGELLDTTTNVPDLGLGLRTDFAACIEEDNDFYCVLLDATSQEEIEALAGYILGLESSNPKILLARTFDTLVKQDPDVDSVAYNLKDNNNDNTALMYTQSSDYVDCAWAGRCLPEDAGTLNWAYKQLTGVSPDTTLTENELGILEAKNVNWYIPLAGVSATQYGSMAGAEWIDVMRGAHWLGARIRERILTLLLNSPKIPFTDPGIATVKAEILAQLQSGVGRGFLAASPEPTCFVPLAADVSAVDKSNRHLQDVTFRATLANAINKTTIFGELNL